MIRAIFEWAVMLVMLDLAVLCTVGVTLLAWSSWRELRRR